MKSIIRKNMPDDPQKFMEGKIIIVVFFSLQRLKLSPVANEFW